MILPAITVGRISSLKRRIASASLGCLLCFSAAELCAEVITFTTTDLADATPGEDLWRYSYHVSDYVFGNGEGFTITFDRTLFTQLQSPPPLINSDWEALTLQPDLALSSDGFYDALALRAAPSLVDDFTLSVVWLGAGTPGAQPFVIYDSSFAPIAQGQTVPEPGISILIVAGFVALGAGRRPGRR